jgi:hypothetical protein
MRPRVADPLEPGQLWAISPGGGEENSGLYRIEVNEGPGSGLKVLNKPVHNAVTIAEIAVEKGATALLMPVACRRQLVSASIVFTPAISSNAMFRLLVFMLKVAMQ